MTSILPTPASLACRRLRELYGVRGGCHRHRQPDEQAFLFACETLVASGEAEWVPVQLSLFVAPAIAPPSQEWGRCCGDCLIDVIDIDERYMVHDHVWPIARDGGVLCIGCLEKRIGRRLNADDFTDCLGNQGAWPRSERLQSRMASAARPT